MLYIYLRYVLIGFFLLLGGWLQYRLGMGSAWYLYLAAILLLISHVIFGNVWLAFNLLKKGKPAQARQVLSHVWFPGLLLPANRAYYHFTKGLLHTQRKSFDAAEAEIATAYELGLRHDNDKALACLNLAHIAYQNKNTAEALRWLEQGEANSPSDMVIQDKLRMLRERIGG